VGRALGRVFGGWLSSGLLLACNHASKPSAAGCCDQPDPARAAETGTEGRIAAEAGALGPALAGPRFRKEEGCARDFKSSGTPVEDVATLERFCAQGMAPILTEPVSARASSAGVVEVPFQVGSAACLRAAAVASAGSLTVSLVDPRGVSLADASSVQPLGVVPVDGPVCVREPGAYRTVVRVSSPSAEATNVTVQVWQASRD
jgi:hypothetical protein